MNLRFENVQMVKSDFCSNFPKFSLWTQIAKKLLLHFTKIGSSLEFAHFSFVNSFSLISMNVKFDAKVVSKRIELDVMITL